IAALGGDVLMQQPVVVNMGKEIGRVKEATSPDEDAPQWGKLDVRAPLWEAATAVGYMEAGAELFIVRNPEALQQAKTAVEALWPKA
ncbi:MAG: acetyl-CoA decarbonylase/synthase complex subunit delta, partial [Candidatus Brocadiae bacterium]|nr:acetyl-CoA decarbonylase/synthase complex subunit delta [Candidatus Brocadiia bacterium]